MKHLYAILVAIIFSAVTLVAQTPPSRYWVYFTDKNGSPYSISNPSAYLSARAIQRRANQGISIQQNDLPPNPAYISGIEALGVDVVYSSKWMNAVSIFTTDTAKVTQVMALPYVRSVKTVKRLKGPKKPAHKLEPIASNKSSLIRTSSAGYDYGASYRQINMIGGDQLHTLGYKGQGMVIAVLDAGFYAVNTLPAFDSLFDDNRILGTWDFVIGESSVYEDHWHGTMVLSTMAANLPGELIGTAPEASYWLLRTEDAATETLVEETNWLRGAEFADSVGADIINSSLGYTTFDDPSMNHTYSDMNGDSTIITKAADLAASKGILVVNSAGNEGNSGWHYIGAPADGDSVLSIGAVDSSGTIAGFSSYGPTADGRIKPNVCAMGEGTILAGAGGGTGPGNGTSFSGPVIAGMSACLWQANPEKTNMQVFEAIQQSADRYSSPTDHYGYGIPNFSLANILLDVKNVQKSFLTTLNVYPNPFTDKLEYMLYTLDSQHIDLDVYDLKGQMIYSKNIKPSGNSYYVGTFTPPISMAAGMYFIRMRTEKATTVIKIIKN